MGGTTRPSSSRLHFSKVMRLSLVVFLVAITVCFFILQIRFQAKKTTPFLKTPKARPVSWEDVRRNAIKHSVLLLGNAPSIMQLPLHLLSGEPHVLVMNRFPLIADRYPWKPDFYICIDSVVCKDNADEINQYLAENRNVIGFFPSNFGAHRYDYIDDGPNVLRFHFDKSPNARGRYSPHSSMPMTVTTWGTVASAALEVVSNIGFKNVFVAGIDMKYTMDQSGTSAHGLVVQATEDNDPNHFDDRYFGKGKKFKIPDVKHVMFPSLLKAVKLARAKGTFVMNAGFIGQQTSLDSARFPRVSMRELVGSPQEVLEREYRVLGNFLGAIGSMDPALARRIYSFRRVYYSFLEFKNYEAPLQQFEGMELMVIALKGNYLSRVMILKEVAKTFHLLGPTESGEYVCILKSSRPASPWLDKS